MICEHTDCTDPATVGYNNRWLCLTHFGEAMQEIGRLLEVLRNKPRPSVTQRLSSTRP